MLQSGTLGRRRVAALPLQALQARRGWAAALLVYFLFQASVGLAWDIRWHAAVGRDDFWSLPHLLIYSGVAGAGLLCLAVVLASSARVWRGDALEAAQSVRVLGLFHGPLGFVAAGFGAAFLLLAAPFDNLWHELYGIDVALWAPFHLMGLLGGGIAALGCVQAAAAQATRARRQGWTRPLLAGYGGWELLTLFALSGLYAGALILAQPGSVQFPTTDLGLLRVATFPVLLALATTLVSVAAVRFTRRPGAATLTVGLYVVRQAALGVFVPWVIRLTVEAQGLAYRVPDAPPTFQGFQLAVALALLVPALAVDLVAWWGGGRALATVRAAAVAGAAAAVPCFAIAALTSTYLLAFRQVLAVPAEVLLPTLPPLSAFALALPCALAAGALGGLFGSGLGAVLALNER